MIPIHPDSAWQGTSDCRSCGVREMALFADLNEDDFSLIHAPIDDLALQPGQVLFHEGASAMGLFTVREGVIKLVRSTTDGRQRIVRVLRQGDVAGLEALATARYDTEAVALLSARVCRIPLSVIQRLGLQSPRLHKRLMEKWSSALREADDWLAELNFGSARKRVANLVLKLREPDNPELVTLFGREDMGAMLDLKLETVSREISNLVREGALQPLDRQGRRYQIVDEGRLLPA